MAVKGKEEPKAEMTVEQMQAKMQQSFEAKRDAYVKAQLELNREHGFNWVPIVTFKPGVDPEFAMSPEPIEPKN